MSEFPLPFIPLLQAGDLIDLEQLEGGLTTYIKYQGIALGDLVYPNWRGCGFDGRAHDMTGNAIEVSEDNNYSEELGLPVFVPRQIMLVLDQGWAQYSYAVGRQGGPVAAESLRQFCYVGRRPRLAPLLPVAQMRDSHDLVLDPDNVSGSTTQAVVSPYLAMRPNDKVTLTFIGYIDGEEDDRWSQEKTLTSADLGKPLTWQVPKGQLNWIEGGYAEVSYQVAYASGEKGSSSPLQTFQIGPETSERLPAPWIHGHEGEDSIDPGLFPDGLYLRVQAWPDMADGDQLLLHWIGSREADSVVKSLRIDTSAVDSGVVEVRIEPEWLQANLGSQVRVFHQFARESLALGSEPLVLAIRQPLNLTPPIIPDATSEGGDSEHKGVMLAQKGLEGVEVLVPDSVPLRDGDHLEVHWDGDPDGGQHVASSPVSADNPRRFRVPKTAVAANIATGESKRFPVFYRLTPAGEQPQDSPPFRLRITPPDTTTYPYIQCLQATTELSLAMVPESGADLELADWWYMAEGQLLTIEAEGVDAGGQLVSLVVRNAGPVSAAEFADKLIKAKLLRQFLTTLKLNQNFSLMVRMSYDGGKTYIRFPEVSMPLRA